MNKLIITSHYVDEVAVFNLTGDLSLGKGHTELGAAIRLAIHEGQNKFLLNLAEVNYIDSSGLGELVAGFLLVQKNGGKMKLLHLNYRVREIMQMTKLLTIFEVFEDEEEALASFQIGSDEKLKKQSEVITGKLNEALLAS
jgi:anti-sigma B factor antagonist